MHNNNNDVANNRNKNVEMYQLLARGLSNLISDTVMLAGYPIIIIIGGGQL